MSVACSTVLAAGAMSGAVVMWSGPAVAQQADRHSDAGGPTSTTVTEPRLGQELADFDGQRVRTQESAALRATRQAAQARALARAAARAHAAAQAAAQQHAAALAARRAAATQAAAPTPATPATPATPTPSGSAQQIAMSMLSSFGWSSSQFSCLDELWNRESGWSTTAANASGAYGIPQALPGSKMASAGPDWQTDAATQIKWGLGYIQGTYGSPCAAWAHEESTGWY
jgi:hypothetical protein